MEETESASPPKLPDRLRERLRLRHYNIRTERQYVQWVRRFILFLSALLFLYREVLRQDLPWETTE
jgi:hypothetical protein